jgi:hypothetical protein
VHCKKQQGSFFLFADFRDFHNLTSAIMKKAGIAARKKMKYALE